LIGVAPQYLIDAIAIRRPCRELRYSSQLLLHSPPYSLLLLTAEVLLKFGAEAKAEKEQGLEEWIPLFGIYDNGCGNSFITADLVRKLNAKVVGRQRIRVSTFGSHTPIDE
jgi:hypothetical protein